MGAAGLLWVEGRPVSQSLLWAGMVVTVTLVGAYGASEFRKAQRAENEGRLERARREALETLAISERRRANSEKLATIGQLAAGVMHEINNPVAFIGANLDFLEREVLSEQQASREELAEVFRETRTGVERVRQIIGDLRGFSHMDAEEPTECALADVVSDAVRIARLRLQHVARLEVDIPADLPPVLAVRTAAGAGAAQPAGERGGCAGGAGPRGLRGAHHRRARGLPGRPAGGGQRTGLSPARAAAALRDLLHDEGTGEGDGAGAGAVARAGGAVRGHPGGGEPGGGGRAPAPGVPGGRLRQAAS